MYTLEQINEALQNAPWQFAKSMPKIPHSYTLLKKWDEKDRDLWFAVVKHIWENAVEEKFYSRTFKYYYANRYKYWSMDPTIESTDLINRAEVKPTV